MVDVSVLLPTFNRPKWLVEAVDSVLSQEGCSFELLILDNGSGAETEAVMDGITDPRVKKFKAKTNGQFGLHWSYLAEQASGKYLAPFTDDDRMLPGNISAKVAALRESGNPLVYSQAACMDENGADLGKAIGEGVTAFSDLFIVNSIPIVSCVFRSDFASFLNQPFTVLNDWAALLEMAWYGDFLYLPEATVKLRLHKLSDSSRNGVSEHLFLSDQLAIWKKWLREGYTPSEHQWDCMHSAWLLMADAQFGAIRGLA